MRFMTFALPLAATAVVALCPAVAQAPAQDRTAGYAGLAKLPDFSGVWQPDWQQLFATGGRRPMAPATTPAATKILDDYKAKQASGENTQTEAANCVPPGMPQIMRMPYPIEFIYSPERVTIVTETESQVRRIYTDGRPLPDDPDPAFNGWSIGHWEGDTLVVDTIGLNPTTSLMAGLHPTENTKIKETYRLAKPDLLMVETTITDPALFTAPYVMQQAYSRKPGWEIREYVCQENNKDAADEFGRPSMKLE